MDEWIKEENLYEWLEEKIEIKIFEEIKGMEYR